MTFSRFWIFGIYFKDIYNLYQTLASVLVDFDQIEMQLLYLLFFLPRVLGEKGFGRLQLLVYFLLLRVINLAGRLLER